MAKQTFRISTAALALVALALFVLFQGCAGLPSVSSTSTTPPVQQPVVQPVTGMLTYHNDNSRTGLNANETTLTPANVNAATFGKLFWYGVDGQVYAQPLYAANVSMPQGTMNVVYVATEHDSVYAFDASGKTKGALWKVSFLRPGVTTVPQADVNSTIFPEIGITSTPVIDPASGTLYVEAMSKENGAYFQKLHALDMKTGQEKPGSPVIISGSVKGNGAASVNGTVSFDPKLALQRTGLLLANGKVYLAFASHGDTGPYHGWVIAYDAATLQPSGSWCVTPDGFAGAIWMSGGGLSADSNGDIYGISGNGQFNAAFGGQSYSNSYFKISPDLSKVEDYFTPFNNVFLSTNDIDLGSGAALLVPDQPGPHPHLVISAGKEGRIYVVDRDNMGHYHSGDDSQIVQSIPNALGVGTEDMSFSSPAYWNGFVYFAGANGDNLKAYQLTNGQLSTTPVRSATTYGFHGATPAVSANGTTNGIVWTIETTASALHAHDAGNVAHELYNSNQNSGRDGLGSAVRFSVPTVMNGKVYVGTNSALVVYGLVP